MAASSVVFACPCKSRALKLNARKIYIPLALLICLSSAAIPIICANFSSLFSLQDGEVSPASFDVFGFGIDDASAQTTGAGESVASSSAAVSSPAVSSPATGATPYDFIFGTVQFFLLSFFVYYMLVLRPQQVKDEEQARFLKAIKKDDDVVTSSGIFGKVASVGEGFISVEVASGVRLKIDPAHLSAVPKAEAKGARVVNTSSSSNSSSSASHRR